MAWGMDEHADALASERRDDAWVASVLGMPADQVELAIGSLSLEQGVEFLVALRAASELGQMLLGVVEQRDRARAVAAALEQLVERQDQQLAVLRGGGWA